MNDDALDLDRAAALFDKHRAALHRAIALRLDRRVAGRVDASDILQETFLEATRRLPEYQARPRMPFVLWLRWLAREQVLQCHRRHLADKRAVDREAPPLPAEASALLVGSLVGSPSRHAAAAEAADRLRLALQKLGDDEREIILWKHFEQLTSAEIAQLLDVSEAAASKRYVRALERLRGLLIGLGVSSAS